MPFLPFRAVVLRSAVRVNRYARATTASLRTFQPQLGNRKEAASSLLRKVDGKPASVLSEASSRLPTLDAGRFAATNDRLRFANHGESHFKSVVLSQIRDVFTKCCRQLLLDCYEHGVGCHWSCNGNDGDPFSFSGPPNHLLKSIILGAVEVRHGKCISRYNAFLFVAAI